MNIINANSMNSQLKTANMFYMKNIIRTPYEKVLSIIQETLKALNLANKTQSKLFTELQWVIKIIKSHLLYSYEIKEKTYVAELSKNDPDFKQFVDFVTEYNEQVIEMNRKNNFINNELLQKPSFKLKRQYITNNQKIFNLSNKRSNSNDINKNQKEKITINCLKKVMKQSYLNKTPNNNNELIININDNRIFNNQLVNHNLNNSNNSNMIASGMYKNNNYKNRTKMNNGLFNNYNSFSLKNAQNNSRNKQMTSLNMLKQFNSNLSNENNNTINYLNKINKFLNKNTNFQKVNNSNKHISSLNPKKLSNENNQKTSEMDSLEKYSYIYIDHLLKQYNYDTKHITEKDFNIFELKKIVGQSNVLPLM